MEDKPIIRRVVAQPSAWTFSIAPIKELLARYVPPDGMAWADPFCGQSELAEHRNDMDKDVDAPSHLPAEDFARSLPFGLAGVLFDPPYSYRQVSEHYRKAGRRAKSIDTSSHFYTRVRLALAPRIRVGGLAICCGWNSTGMAPKLGFELVELLIVNHGGHHNDTLVTVERKVRDTPAVTEEMLNGDRRQRKLE